MTDIELKELIEDCCNEIADKIEPLANVKSRLYTSLKEAINYTPCCKSDSELLPKRLSNEAYTMAKGTDHKTFTRWWDMQV